MRTTHILILFLGLSSILQAQKDDHQWIFNAWRIDDCSQSNFPEVCNASIIDFNVDPPVFFRAEEAYLDLHNTHTSLCDIDGELMLYSNGMSIHGSDHMPITNGDTISFGTRWPNNTWLNENGEVRTQGFTGIDCAVFVAVPGNSELIYLIYYNFDNFSQNNAFDKYYAIIDISEERPRVISKDLILKEKIREPGHTSCAQHANGRDWWLMQFSNDTVFTYLIDPLGINLNEVHTLPFPIRRGQTAVTYDATAERYAAFQFAESLSDDGAELFLFNFDRCSGQLSDPVSLKLPSHDHSGAQGIAFSASGQYLYINDIQTCLQLDTWASDIFSTQDTVMTYDGSAFYAPSMNIMIPTFFGRMRRGPDGKIYIALPGQGHHLHIIHSPDLPADLCRPEQNAIRMPTFTLGTLPTHNTLRLGPLDGSSCDTLGLDNNPVSRFRYEQDTLDFMDISFVDLSYFEPTRWEWNFGDGTSSIEPSPFHAYDEDGIYEVCLTVSNENSSDISCDTLFLGVSSLDDQTEDRHITLFPNPVETVTRVAIHDYLPQAAVIRIFNQSGQLVQIAALGGVTTTVDMSALTSGIYVYEVWDGEKRLSGGKVFKM